MSWHLQSSDIGKVRRGKFHPDPLLPLVWQIYPSDYTNSGYERGHQCPSKDRSATRDEVPDQNDDTDHQQQVNEAAGDVEGEKAQRPQDEQDDGDCQEHE